MFTYKGTIKDLAKFQSAFPPEHVTLSHVDTINIAKSQLYGLFEELGVPANAVDAEVFNSVPPDHYI